MAGADIDFVDGLLLGEHDNVLVVGWLNHATVAAARRVHERARSLGTRHPRGTAHVNIIPRMQFQMLGDEARAAFLELLRDRRLSLVTSVIVFGDGGFMSAVIRGVLSSVTMVSGSSAKMEFVPSPDEAERKIRNALGAAGASVPDPGRITELAREVSHRGAARGFGF